LAYPPVMGGGRLVSFHSRNVVVRERKRDLDTKGVN
jgi:hypothetical protein